MLVVRSFDINKPGTEPEKIKGGVLGGAILEGKLKVGEQVEISPVKIGEKWQSITTEITGLQKASKDLDEAGPGGLVGVMTKLDPFLTKADNISGSVVGLPGKMPPILNSLKMKFNLFKDTDPVKVGENLMIIVGTSKTVGTVDVIKKGVAEINLKIPVVISHNDRAAISRNINDRWKLIGWGATA
jgi:translation initiation factor 2 subunit 3